MTVKHSDRKMSAEAFREWRKGLGLTQAEAADRLGLGRRVVQYYETGRRDGRPVEVPHTVRLACWALAQGVHDFDGRTALGTGETLTV
jgi:transcriptional regulator with XRE-family HTH domain